MMILHTFTCLVLLTLVQARTEHYFGPHMHIVIEEDQEAPDVQHYRNRRSAGRGDGKNVLVGLTPEQHEESIQLHHYYRRKVPASNMQKLRFNLPLAEMLYNLTESCYIRHWWPPTWPRQPYNSGWIGQNLYATNGWLNISFAVDGWDAEKQWYDYETNSCHGPQCGHYTQLVWGDSALIGCAYSFCPDFTLPNKKKSKNWHFYGCNYGPPGNINGVKPYKLGPACSQCAETNAFWCDMTEPRGMCVAKPDDAASNNVVCAGTSWCKNGGAISCDCTCKCANGFRGRFCEAPCADKDTRCGGSYPTYYCTHPVYANTMKGLCPMTCGLCGIESPEPCADFSTVLPGSNTDAPMINRRSPANPVRRLILKR